MMKRLLTIIAACLLFVTGCTEQQSSPEPDEQDIPGDIFAPMGEPLPSATDEQLRDFERGKAVAEHRFSPEEGLGPRFNVDSCASCHLSPATGGGASRYRNFFLVGQRLEDGTFLMGPREGIVHTYGIEEFAPVRPPLDDSTNVVAQRNPIPLFGTGLIAEIPEESILQHADPDDESGDGISGRPNYDGQFVGRFGRKAQTVDIEGFIRGPIFNHMGITTDPLPDERLAELPVPSDDDSPIRQALSGDIEQHQQPQASPPSEPLEDDDDIADPELGEDALFDLVSFNMLLAAPRPAEPTDASRRGEEHFHDIGCTDCHVPTLESPRGDIPLYSDLLLHDMGDELADGIEMGQATGSEFRTQPLWGVAATGPWLHDGRADSLHDAIEWHGGEAQQAREAYLNLGDGEQRDLIAFLESLGGTDHISDGILIDGEEAPPAGEAGGPRADLSDDELKQWQDGRRAFDRDAGADDGRGDPHFNSDSCRSCHGEVVGAPTGERPIGGAGPRDVSVTRAGRWTDDGQFVAPESGTILPRVSNHDHRRLEAPDDANTFELRASPTLFGLGLVETIDDDVLRDLADPDDERGDGIQGRVSELPDGRIGRFGWKADIPELREFSRDALSNELGRTVVDEVGFSFGDVADDGQPAEAKSDEIDDITAFVRGLAPPDPSTAEEQYAGGRTLFDDIGCTDCHVPELPGEDGPVPLYSDLLLHDVAPDDYLGIPTANATGREFRTPPLWGLSDNAPYMHDGMATTIEDAILRHEATAADSRDAFLSLDDDERQKLLDFLNAL